MFHSFGVSVRRRFLLVAAVGALLLVFPVHAVRGEDGHYVLRDGRKVPMVKSSDELGVVFHRGLDIKACARRLANSGRGRVSDVPGAPRARVKILKVSHATARRRGLVQQELDVESVHPVYRFKGVDVPMIGTGQIVLKLRSGLGDAGREKLLSDYRIRILDQAEGLSRVYRVVPVDRDVDEVRLAELLAADWRTLWAQPNLRRPPRTRQAVVASDEFFGRQWHLDNTGQLGGTPDADIDAPEAWLLAAGQGVLIGMFDDACDVDHEDLRANYLGTGHDPTVPSNDPGFTDPRPKQIGDQHGTAVMGLAVARANTLGGRGVAFLAQFTVSRGFGSALTDFDVASVFTFARQQDVDVHLNSWGIDGPNSAIIEDAIRTAFEQGRPLGEDNLGMVIVFAAGNDNIENLPGMDYSTMPEVIGVGSSTDTDQRSGFSNFGVNIDVLAPGGSDTGPGLLTTDNEDILGRADNGFNVGGGDPITGNVEVDVAGKYTGTFAGTSASCPITAGVAALIISRNPRLKATDVRLILEHTADRIDPAVAGYHGITSRSERYGFGRINAEQSVKAAQESTLNGGFTWPERVFGITLTSDSLRWVTSVGTNEFLVVESDTPFEFVPQDAQCYDVRQAGCGSIPLSSLPSGVRVLGVVQCVGGCGLGSTQSVAFDSASGTKHFGIFGRNLIGRYSFGVSTDTDGNVLDAGPVLAKTDGGSSTNGGAGPDGPRVTVSAAPLEGTSPLTVEFNWNAISSISVDETRTQWVFDVNDPGSTTVIAPARPFEFEYVVSPGQSKTFTAQLTMYDTDGNSGTAAVMIRVTGPMSNGGGLGSDTISVVVGVPGSVGLEVDRGVSPFSVMLSVDASALEGSIQSILWDLGDGTAASSFDVLHTYVNGTDEDLVLAVTATVTFVSPGGTTSETSATRFITVNPGGILIEPIQPPDFGPVGSGSATSTCGAMGMVLLFAFPISLSFLRRRRFR